MVQTGNDTQSAFDVSCLNFLIKKTFLFQNQYLQDVKLDLLFINSLNIALKAGPVPHFLKFTPAIHTYIAQH